MTVSRPLLAGKLLVLATGLVLATVAACGGSDTSSSDGAAAAGDAGASSAVLQEAYEGISGPLPTVTEKPQAGVDLWVISCGQMSVGCVEPTEAAVEAGDAAGWNTNICDGKLNPAGWGACIRQAVSAQADVIITEGIDCPAVQAPLAEAKAAGVVTVNAGGFDCDVVGGEKLYSAVTQQLDGMTSEDFTRKMGALQADYLIGKTNGTAQVLIVNFTDPVWGPMITEGFTAELATCSGCKVVKQLDIGNQDMINNTLGTKFSSALLQNPAVNAVAFPVDGFLTAGIGQAITSSGRGNQITVIGNHGNAPNMDVVRDGGAQDAGVGYSSAQLSWAAVDDAIRLLAGQEPAPSAGVGLVAIDTDHNLPPAGEPYQSPVDFESLYRQGWGVA